MATAEGMGTWQERVDGYAARVFRGRFLQQFAALFYKNVLVAWRSRRATALRLFAPFLFLLLALVVNVSLNANNKTQIRNRDTPATAPEAINNIPDCSNDMYMSGKPCVNFIYTPSDDTVVQDIVKRIRTNNVPPIPEGKVLGFPNRSACDDWMLAHPDLSMGAVHFVRDGGSTNYIIQSNSTTRYFKGNFQDPNTFFQIPLMNAVTRELARDALAAAQPGTNLTWQPALVRFPHPNLEGSNILGSVLAAFIFASLMFGVVSQMGNLATEKSAGLRQALRNMGMLESSYWSSWMAFDAVFTFASAFLLVIFGLILQFDYFKKNDFGVMLLLFWLFGLSMTSFSYLLSVFLKQAEGAVYCGFVIFIVGWVFQTIQFAAKLPYSPDYYYATDNIWGKVFYWLFHLLPWNPFTKGVMDLAAATNGASNPGLKWEDRTRYCQYVPDPAKQESYDPNTQYRDYNCLFPMSQVYVVMIVQWVAYLMVAIYLNNVLPNEVGTRRKPWYFLTPSYWIPRSTSVHTALQQVLQEERTGYMQPPKEGDQEEDVAAEADKMVALLQEHLGVSGSDMEGSAAQQKHLAVELYGLRKRFAGLGQACKGRAQEFWAIKGSWFGIPEGQLFCLLGPNGAGKTTTINCLTGVLPFTGGDAIVYGEPISSEGGMDRIRSIMGVCPQFDVLWGELSGKEHLVIYGHVKGLPFTQVRGEAARLLERVKLTYASGVRSGSYSGGMKRRLSVAIALLGDPKIVYLDEPTTGMDPISRRYVWDIIQEAKPGRAIVLTTHSMEEADILGDRIAIMARGHVKAIGSSIRLKQKFGEGYQVSVSMQSVLGGSAANLQALAAKGARVKEFFQQRLGLQPRDEGRSYLQYLVPRDSEGRLVSFLQDLDAQKAALGVTDVQISLASLEEVFLTIAKKAELDAAALSGRTTMKVDLPDREEGQLEVALGEELVQHASTGRWYAVKWTQDDKGRLVVMEVVPADAEKMQ